MWRATATGYPFADPAKMCTPKMAGTVKSYGSNRCSASGCRRSRNSTGAGLEMELGSSVPTQVLCLQVIFCKGQVGYD